jgi:hypothetical protein
MAARAQLTGPRARPRCRPRRAQRVPNGGMRRRSRAAAPRGCAVRASTLPVAAMAMVMSAATAPSTMAASISCDPSGLVIRVRRGVRLRVRATMGFYAEWILPSLIDLSMRNKRLRPYRERTAGAAEGRVSCEQRLAARCILSNRWNKPRWNRLLSPAQQIWHRYADHCRQRHLHRRHHHLRRSPAARNGRHERQYSRRRGVLQRCDQSSVRPKH